ncbi:MULTISPECIES: putative entry exclusion protein TrbK-alt [unclassified Sphingobium]|uniref:putative entry exclusion protein TrbK-alt n=1 Tax=unclassified Sphingobium TaxID=2611147 RepID=UPI0035A64F76
MTEEEAPRHESRLPGWPAWALGAVGVGTIAGMIGLIALRDPAPSAPRFAVVAEDAPPAQSASGDPLMAELLRCRPLPAGSTDAACEQAWEVNRRRFLGETRSYVPPRAAAPSPAPATPIVER